MEAAAVGVTVEVVEAEVTVEASIHGAVQTNAGSGEEVEVEQANGLLPPSSSKDSLRLRPINE